MDNNTILLVSFISAFSFMIVGCRQSNLPPQSEIEAVYLFWDSDSRFRREVAQITLETGHERDTERFEEVLAQFPRFVGHDPSRFRSSRQLANGLFFETNLSATSIHRLCVQVSELSGMSSEDWRVEYAPSADRQPEPEKREKRVDWLNLV
jgi:hypothetical protein